MRKRWFYKTTNPIQVIEECEIPLGTVNGFYYRVDTVLAGINTDSGRVFINYNGCSPSKLSFWIVHFHEFLHRLIWLLKWDSGHKILDIFDRRFWWASVVKDLRTGTSKTVKEVQIVYG